MWHLALSGHLPLESWAAILAVQVPWGHHAMKKPKLAALGKSCSEAEMTRRQREIPGQAPLPQLQLHLLPLIAQLRLHPQLPSRALTETPTHRNRERECRKGSLLFKATKHGGELLPTIVTRRLPNPSNLSVSPLWEQTLSVLLAGSSNSLWLHKN